MRSKAARPAKPDLLQPSLARVSVLVVLLLMISVGVGAIARGPGHPVAVQIVGMSDPSKVGVVTRISLRVTNHGTTAIAPVFATFSSSSTQFYPISWRRTSGPVSLAPGAIGSYDVQPPPGTGIAVSDEFVVRMGDTRTHTYAVSPPTRGDLESRLALVNPGFTWWVTDPATGQPTPFGWQPTSFGGPLGPDLGVQHSIIAGRQALAFRISDGVRTPRWRAVRVDQNVNGTRQLAALVDNGLSVFVYPTFNYTQGFAPTGSAQPGNALGIQIIGDSRLLWILFSDTGAGWYVGRDYAVVVLRSPLNQWTHHRVDLRAMYRRLDWTTPHNVLFSLFAATRNGSTMPGPAFGQIIPGALGRSHAGAQARRPAGAR